MKEFLKMDQHYNVTDITKIRETSYRLITYLKVYIKYRQKPIKLFIDDIDIFLETILKINSKIKEITYDKENKIIYFTDKI